jgi:hypothetical protein
LVGSSNFEGVQGLPRPHPESRVDGPPEFRNRFAVCGQGTSQAAGRLRELKDKLESSALGGIEFVKKAIEELGGANETIIMLGAQVLQS